MGEVRTSSAHTIHFSSYPSQPFSHHRSLTNCLHWGGISTPIPFPLKSQRLDRVVQHTARAERVNFDEELSLSFTSAAGLQSDASRLSSQLQSSQALCKSTSDLPGTLCRVAQLHPGNYKTEQVPQDSTDFAKLTVPLDRWNPRLILLPKCCHKVSDSFPNV